MAWRNEFLFPSAITIDTLLFFLILGRVEHAWPSAQHCNLIGIPHSQYSTGNLVLETARVLWEPMTPSLFYSKASTRSAITQQDCFQFQLLLFLLFGHIPYFFYFYSQQLAK